MMELTNIHVIKDLLERHGFHFSKAKGQNFLIAGWVPERIAEEAGVAQDVGVLEIGPGIGSLTQQLCLRAKKVCAVELDKRLAPILEQTVGEFQNLEIVWDDVLKQDIRYRMKTAFSAPRQRWIWSAIWIVTTRCCFCSRAAEAPCLRSP